MCPPPWLLLSGNPLNAAQPPTANARPVAVNKQTLLFSEQSRMQDCVELPVIPLRIRISGRKRQPPSKRRIPVVNLVTNRAPSQDKGGTWYNDGSTMTVTLVVINMGEFQKWPYCNELSSMVRCCVHYHCYPPTRSTTKNVQET